MKKVIILMFCFAALISCTIGQPLNKNTKLTRQDTLRGTITDARAWWDVMRYDLEVTPDFESKSIKGRTTISYKVLPGQKSDYMQIDLQNPLKIDTIYYDGKLYINYPAKPYYNEGNVWMIPLPKAQPNSEHKITLVYSGTPRAAKNPPWDGGWIWRKDKQGRPWMSVACQGLGASVWYPCKDHQSDEPDKGATLTVNVPSSLIAVGNGRLKSKTVNDTITSYTWEVVNPINNYNIIPYIGKYVNFSEEYAGEKGKLTMNYWVLDYNLDKARKQFVQAPMTLKAFEYWFGPYPWYEDGFQLVESNHLGMEHQSAVAYGNQYKNGYLGMDLSGTGVGKKWDFIIVHEIGHEWYGNNITTKDIADMWVHEGFTAYSEVLFHEFHFGKEEANQYAQGIRNNIENDIPIIGPYGVNKEGSGDMYYKGSNMLHTIRQIINDDEKFRSILRGMNKTFWHQTVTTKQIEEYINKESGKDFSKVFDQYLRHAKLPVLKLDVDGNSLRYKWDEAIKGFNMPVKLSNGQWVSPTDKEQKIEVPREEALKVDVDPNFYIEVKKDD